MTKKFFFCLLPALFLFSIGLFGCANHRENATLTPVTLNEVAHSVFYAPLYVSMENGYFKEEDIGLSLVTGFGADKTMTAVLSGEADIGFMGPETTVYAASEGASDTIVNFAQLTQRAGNFLVARAPSDTFSWDDVKGKTVLGGRKGGMPEMVFEYVLRQNGIDPAADLVIDQGIDFGSTAAAFSGGNGDYTVEFEPSATALEREGAGYVVASLGVDSGYVPYTAFSAKKSYLNGNHDTVQAFTNALQKGMLYVSTHSPEEIAAVISLHSSRIPTRKRSLPSFPAIKSRIPGKVTSSFLLTVTTFCLPSYLAQANFPKNRITVCWSAPTLRRKQLPP